MLQEITERIQAVTNHVNEDLHAAEKKISTLVQDLRQHAASEEEEIKDRLQHLDNFSQAITIAKEHLRHARDLI